MNAEYAFPNACSTEIAMALQLVNIAQLKPGQVVATAVTNSGGAVLCPVGFKLTEKAIERLGNAGVDAVVVDVNEKLMANIDRRIEALQKRFEGVDDPIMLQLKATVEQRLNFMKI